MIKLWKGFYIHFSVFVLFIISFLSGTFLITAMAFLTALCHELCHLFTALSLKEKCRGVAIMPYGCRLFMGMGTSPLKEFFIAASGPLFNILSALIIKEGPLCEINLAMAIINLFPVMPLDGGRMINALLAAAFGGFKASGIMKRISLAGGVILIALGIAQAILTGFNLSAFTAGAFLLFSAITQNGSESLYVNALTNKEKMKEGLKKGTLLVAKESLPARKILPEIPPGKYAVVKVLDREGNIKCEMTEDEIIGKIMECGSGVRLREIT